MKKQTNGEHKYELHEPVTRAEQLSAPSSPSIYANSGPKRRLSFTHCNSPAQRSIKCMAHIQGIEAKTMNMINIAPFIYSLLSSGEYFQALGSEAATERIWVGLQLGLLHHVSCNIVFLLAPHHIPATLESNRCLSRKF